jgi:type I restriction enzyme M protein
MPRFGKRTPLTRAHFAEFEACYATRALPEGRGQPEKTPENLTSRYRSFSREWIRERADSLDIAWLKDDNAEDAADLPEPAVLAQEAMGELEGALAELQAILAELGEVGE